MLFTKRSRSAQYSKLEDSTDGSPTQQSIKGYSGTVMAAVVLLLCAFSFSAGWILRAVAGSTRPQGLRDIIPTLPVTTFSRQQVMTLRAMQAAPPADGSHEPAWDKLIPNGLGYVRHPTLAPNVSVVGVFHQLHCLYTVRRAYFAAHAASLGQHFNRAGVRGPEHIGHCLDYLQQSLVCAADVGIEPFYAGGHYPDMMFGRQCRDFGEVQAWASQWRVINGSGFIFDAMP